MQVSACSFGYNYRIMDSLCLYFKVTVQHGFYFGRFVIALAVDKGVTDNAPVAPGLEQSFGYTEYLTHLMVVDSLFSALRWKNRFKMTP